MPAHSSIVAAAVTFLCLLSTAAASTLTVTVGNGGLVFKPNSTTAAVGDIIEFHYFPKNHSVTQGPFNTPCMSTSGFYSGFMPTAAGEASSVFRVTVNDTNPIWFYCSQPALGGHCAQGMVGVINEPKSGVNTLAAYAAHAMNTTSATVSHPAVIGGGVIAANPNASNASSSVASSSSASATASVASTASTATSTPSTAATSGAARMGASTWTEMLSLAVAMGALVVFAM